MDLLKLAHSFKNDPNFNVNVEIHYKNANSSDGARKLQQVQNAAKKYGQSIKL
jgi:hypothetical protein